MGRHYQLHASENNLNKNELEKKTEVNLTMKHANRQLKKSLDAKKTEKYIYELKAL